MSKIKEAIINRPERNLFRFQFVGRSYGEVPKKTKAYEGKNPVYIDLKSKNHIELVNIAVIKIDIEDDFVAFYLERFAKILLELDIIDEEQYNDVFIVQMILE